MKIQELSIDLETYSDVDISKCGVYKYAESDNFEILLFGVSVDGGDVTVYDLACGDTIPEEILDALTDDTITKWAFNASFERICISNWLKNHYPDKFKGYGIPEDPASKYLDPASWKCTMIWSAYMGLPLSLESVGAVLKLQDQKMKEGKDLIRYFCSPCKATKVNGGRTRNLPEHAPDKWETFKAFSRNLYRKLKCRHQNTFHTHLADFNTSSFCFWSIFELLDTFLCSLHIQIFLTFFNIYSGFHFLSFLLCAFTPQARTRADQSC